MKKKANSELPYLQGQARSKLRRERGSENQENYKTEGFCADVG